MEIRDWGRFVLIVAKAKASTFADRLRALRVGKDLTQAVAAESVGVHLQTYMRWERGTTEPSFTQLCALAELFGVQLNDFRPEE